MHEKHAGIIFILTASLMWALEPIFAKLAYASADFLHTSAIRAIFACLTSLLYIAIRDIKKISLPSRYLPPLLYIAFVGTLFADLIYFLALTMVPVINAVIIGHMQPLFIVLFGFFILKESLTRYDYAGMIFMMFSGIFVSSRTLSNLLSFHFGSIGDFFVLLATIAWATTAITARKYLRSIFPATIAFYRFLFASIILSAYLFLFSRLIISNLYQVIVGIIVGVGTILYYEAIHRLKAAQVASLELSSPFFAAFLSFIILHEIITPLQIAGILLLCIGVYLLSKKED
ncbi:MAG TPA: DMT family transporter [Thermoplasmatales archaeon]|nr:DMT family transporter [Thermoplasmatales archaeon]